MSYDFIELQPHLKGGSAQDIFDHVCEHLANQKKQALGIDGCVYHEPTTGDRCAVGGCLTEESAMMAESEIGGCQVTVDWDLPHTGLFQALQYCHDEYTTVDSITEALNATADDFGLDRSKVSLITEWS